ncbi:MAG TPA: ATP-binding protein [Rhodobacteraceae bacterium]|jgi:serine/threonine-protein kinase RsbW|nr:ATP-binding protein [Paracoccaceae bacterium]HBG98902.1 ATP-binding protein [Paracoccaceae bacterium]
MTGPRGRPGALRLRIDSRAEAVRGALAATRAHVAAAVDNGASDADCRPGNGAALPDPDTVELLLAELLNNVVRHACRGRPGHSIEIALRERPDGLLVLIRDDGVPMPGGAPPPGRVHDPDDLPEGGFGWGLIRMLARDIRYARRRGRNRIALVIPPG